MIERIEQQKMIKYVQVWKRDRQTNRKGIVTYSQCDQMLKYKVAQNFPKK